MGDIFASQYQKETETTSASAVKGTHPLPSWVGNFNAAARVAQTGNSGNSGNSGNCCARPAVRADHENKPLRAGR